MSITVLLADDQTLIRSGLAMVLSAQPAITVVGEACNGAEALTKVRDLTPDVVLMDIGMPVMDGIEATRRLTTDNFTPDPDYTAKVLVVTCLGNDEDVFEALRAGASGYVLKDADPAELTTAIECVAKGNGYLTPAITRGVITDIATRASPTTNAVAGILNRLTPREREILTLIAHGLTTEAIAARLHLALGTVKTHVCRILMRLEVHERSQAVVIAYQQKLVEPGDAPPL